MALAVFLALKIWELYEYFKKAKSLFKIVSKYNVIYIEISTKSVYFKQQASYIQFFFKAMQFLKNRIKSKNSI